MLRLLRFETFVALLVMIGLSACSPANTNNSPEPAPSSSPTRSTEASTVSTAPTASSSSPAGSPTDETGHPSASSRVTADPKLVATMECEPLEAWVMAYGEEYFGTTEQPGKQAQVLVGEGNKPNERWWIVAFHDIPPNFSSARWLTNQPDLPDEQGTWINLGDKIPLPNGDVGPSLNNVHWPHAKLVAARSALAKADECVRE